MFSATELAKACTTGVFGLLGMSRWTKISSPFLVSERKTITDRIAELEQEEKQNKGFIHKLYFEQSQTDSVKIASTEFKQHLIHFAMHTPSFSTAQLKAEIRNLLTEIIYHPDKLELKFRLLPWHLSFSTDNKNLTTNKEAHSWPLLNRETRQTPLFSHMSLHTHHVRFFGTDLRAFSRTSVFGRWS